MVVDWRDGQLPVPLHRTEIITASGGAGNMSAAQSRSGSVRDASSSCILLARIEAPFCTNPQDKKTSAFRQSLVPELLGLRRVEMGNWRTGALEAG